MEKAKVCSELTDLFGMTDDLKRRHQLMATSNHIWNSSSMGLGLTVYGH